MIPVVKKDNGYPSPIILGTLVMKELLSIGKLSGMGKITRDGKLMADIGFLCGAYHEKPEQVTSFTGISIFFRNVNLHTLRHTCASHLVMAGVDLPTVANILGHTDIKTTMIYKKSGRIPRPSGREDECRGLLGGITP